MKYKNRDVIYLTTQEDVKFDNLIRQKSDEITSFFESQNLRFVYFPEILGFNSPISESDVSPVYKRIIEKEKLKVERHGLYFINSYSRNKYVELESDNFEDLFLEIKFNMHPHNEFQSRIIEDKIDAQIKPNCKKGCVTTITYNYSPFLFDMEDEQFDKRENDEEFDAIEEIETLSWEVKERIDRLRKLGVDYAGLLSLIETKPRLSRMVITERYHILLPDYQEKEIDMRPSTKALYFLFLRHPEGIVFKDLPDYKEEFVHIYSKITTLSSDKAVNSSVEALMNPLQNTINVNCSRIKEAFYKEFKEELAKYYVISGKRGEAKSIKLNRSLVEWRCDF